MTRGFQNLKDTDVWAHGGFTVVDILQAYQGKMDIFDNYDVILLHVGTNSFGDKEEYFHYVDFTMNKISHAEYDAYLSNTARYLPDVDYEQFEYYYSALVALVQAANSRCYILCSAILPRPWDFRRRNRVRCELNHIIQRVADRNSCIYLASDRVFFKDKNFCTKIKRHYFGKKGLHLSDVGSFAFQTYVSDKLRKAIQGSIY